MSITDGLCDLCGVLIEVPNAGRIKSSVTQRYWCGNCNYDQRSKIFVWLFNKDTEIELPRKSSQMMKKAPISRPDWDTYYLGIAKAVSARGDCVRAQHGAVIVKNHKIVSTGYNGSPPGSPDSCGATGACPRNHDPNAKHSEGDYDLCWATHAEANAIMRASWEEMQGATIYVTGKTCPGCTKLIASSGIAKTITA